MVGKGEVQQRPGGQHRQIAHVLAEVPERGDGLGNGLDLIEEEQSVRADGADAGQCLEDVQQVDGVVAGEGGGEVAVTLEVDLGLSGRLHRSANSRTSVDLPTLPGAPEDQRFPTGCGQPVIEKFELFSIHASTHPRYRQGRSVAKKGCVSWVECMKQGGV